jgi:hypothetical protein
MAGCKLSSLALLCWFTAPQKRFAVAFDAEVAVVVLVDLINTH